MMINTTNATLHQLVTDTNSTVQLELIIFLILLAISLASALYLVKLGIDHLPINLQLKSLISCIGTMFVLLSTVSFMRIIVSFFFTFLGAVTSMLIVGAALFCNTHEVIRSEDK